MTFAVPVAVSFGLAVCVVSHGDPLVAQGDLAGREASTVAAPSGTPAFPVDMLLIEGRKVTLGTTAKELADITKDFHPRAPRPRMRLLKKLMSELGQATVDVDSFYLHRTPVTNEQYLQFVQSSNHPFPFHWWKFGRKDDWEQRRAEFSEAFKGQRNADNLYWERYWEKLPYAIPEGEEKFPVVFVSWLDAQAFAGWAGMRLPTEAEWMLAATGGQKKQFLWGDQWDRSWLKKLRLYNSRDKTLRAVGALGEIARGPFAHEDMVGNVWEWVSDVGYFPLCGEDAYKKELAKLERLKLPEAIEEPDWSGAQRVLKGASYFSWQSPAEFRVGTRAYMGRTQRVEGAGFRVAKSTVPGRDMCRSRIAVEYDGSFFGSDREPNVDDQIGVERYDLADEGRLITNYHAVALVPVNHMGLDRRLSLDKLKEEAREKPLIVATFVTTEPIENPKLEPGMYTVYFRQKGMPKELVDALKEGSRVLLAERRAAEKGEKKKDEKPAEESSKQEKDDWRSILAKYGITEDEAAEKGAHTKIDFVRIKPGDVKIPTATSQYVFRKNNGDFVASIEAPKDLGTGSYRGSEMSIGTQGRNEALEFKFGSPWSPKVKTKNLTFSMTVELTHPHDVSRPWRTPKGTKIAGPAQQQRDSGNHMVRPIRDDGRRK